MRKPLRLGVNIDHIATIRNARGGVHPCPIQGALLAKDAGADGITAHLREDRRHIKDRDIERLKAEVNLPLNLEMAPTEEMLAIALKTKPNAVCLVPERREEVTTEGGLDVAQLKPILTNMVPALKKAGIRVSLFIAATPAQVDAAKAVGADIVEFHTGHYCQVAGAVQSEDLERIQAAAKQAHGLGIECHAGHGLNYTNVAPIAAIPEIVELNIGHFLIGESVFVGLKDAIQTMRSHMDAARKKVAA